MIIEVVSGKLVIIEVVGGKNSIDIVPKASMEQRNDSMTANQKRKNYYISKVAGITTVKKYQFDQGEMLNQFA